MDTLHVDALHAILGIVAYVLVIGFYFPKVILNRRVPLGIGLALGALLLLLVGYFAEPYVVRLVAIYPASATALLALSVATAAYFAFTRFPRAAAEKVWSREVPLYPFGPQITELGNMVDAIRLEAVACLMRAHVATVQTGYARVRANVFLLDYNDAENGVVGTLWMPPGLQKGQMYHAEENRLRLWPGQGVNGLVFIENRPIIETQPGFNLPRHLQDGLHRNLEWIISFPLDPGLGYPLGMFNIDGLLKVANTADDTQAILGKMRDELSNQVAAFAGKLAQLPRMVLTLSTTSRVNVRAGGLPPSSKS